MTVEIHLSSWLQPCCVAGNIVVVILATLVVVAGLLFVIRCLRGAPDAAAGDDIVGLGLITVGVAFIFIGLTNLGVVVVS